MEEEPSQDIISRETKWQELEKERFNLSEVSEDKRIETGQNSIENQKQAEAFDNENEKQEWFDRQHIIGLFKQVDFSDLLKFGVSNFSQLENMPDTVLRETTRDFATPRLISGDSVFRSLEGSLLRGKHISSQEQSPVSPESHAENGEAEKEINYSDKIVDRVIDFVSNDIIDETIFSRPSRFLDVVHEQVTIPKQEAINAVKKQFQDYQNHPQAKPEYILRSMKAYSELSERVQSLTRGGEVGEDVVKIWLKPGMIDESGIKRKFYDEMTQADYQSEMSATEWMSRRDKYKLFVVNLAKKFDNSALSTQETFGNEPLEDPEELFYRQGETFLHFNADKDRGDGTDLRVYVSANMLRDPSAAIYAWGESLDESGLKDSLYFKIPTRIVNDNKHDKQRMDNIVVYKNDSIPDDKFKNLLQIFENKCKAMSPDVLADSQHTLPATIEIAQGITVAPEPSYINEYLRCVGDKDNRHSYNTFIDRMLSLSIGVANERMGGNITSITETGVKDEVKKAFREFMKLAKINPDTMLPDKYGDDLPDWAKLH